MTGSRRRWVFGTLVLVVGSVVLLALIHAPFNRRSAIELVSELLSDRYGIRMQALGSTTTC